MDNGSAKVAAPAVVRLWEMEAGAPRIQINNVTIVDEGTEVKVDREDITRAAGFTVRDGNFRKPKSVRKG